MCLLRGFRLLWSTCNLVGDRSLTTAVSQRCYNGKQRYVIVISPVRTTEELEAILLPLQNRHCSRDVLERDDFSVTQTSKAHLSRVAPIAAPEHNLQRKYWDCCFVLVEDTRIPMGCYHTQCNARTSCWHAVTDAPT